jgi:hypothetical protein
LAQHRKIDELMVRHFGAERVDQFYHENNVAELRQRDIESVKMMRPYAGLFDQRGRLNGNPH